MNHQLVSAQRDVVQKAYASAEAENRYKFLEGDVSATNEYIYSNQKEDACAILDAFYNRHRRVVSVAKKTKVGADGLMIEIARLFTTHPDDAFIVSLPNVRIITGMSNAGWEKDMIDKAPQCFKDKIFHHGKLQKSDIKNMHNGLIIIDEIDTGNKENQVLHTTLKEAGVLNVHNMNEANNRFVFISATMIKELYDLYQWGDLHELYMMTIPRSYFGHADFLSKGLLQEFYPLNTRERAAKWITEDIIQNYGSDYRVHIVRVDTTTCRVLQDTCIINNVIFRNHTSNDRLTPEEIDEFFQKPLSQHVVLAVKGFFRRANLIPNQWKLRIGATHELYTKKVDNNVQVQGLPGRMTGYWREIIESGHKTGPHRTSLRAISEYEKSYQEPFGNNTYTTSGFSKVGGRVTSSHPTMLTPHNIDGLVSTPSPSTLFEPRTVPRVFSVTLDEYNTFAKSKRQWDVKTIFNVLQKYDANLVGKLQTLRKEQVTESTEQNDTYKKRIEDFVKASEEDRMYTLGTGDVTDDVYQIFLDKMYCRVIISVYYGTRKSST